MGWNGNLKHIPATSIAYIAISSYDCMPIEYGSVFTDYNTFLYASKTLLPIFLSLAASLPIFGRETAQL